MVMDKLQKGSSVYCVGIKGTGVCALAELMQNAGMKVSGSDTSEKFYTDDILKQLAIPYYEDFDASHITDKIDIIIYSAAYMPETNPELSRAIELNIPIIKYTDALGEWSLRYDSTGVCGVHGKTTTTAMCGVCARAAELPVSVLTGSAALDFGDRATLNIGDKYFIAETCEYRNHFLSFRPRRIILTSVESDHQDFFPDYESMRGAFVAYCRLLPQDGELIYCADDAGAAEVADIIKKERGDIKLIPTGFTACGDYKILSYGIKNERAFFSLSGFSHEFKLRIPGRHEALNAAAAIALTVLLAEKEGKIVSEEKLNAIASALENFKSTRRRSEIIGEIFLPEQKDSILFMDDYGHHPTAIKTTLEGIKSFYPGRRLIVSFMSHTYTRTSALFEDFTNSFNDADILFLHKIYASAREKFTDTMDGKTLYEKTAAIRKTDNQNKETFYISEPEDAFEPVCKLLKPGDIFITLGAGNNRPLAEKVYDILKKEKSI